MDVNQGDGCERWMWLSPGCPALHATSLEPLPEWGLCQQPGKPQPLLEGTGLQLNPGLKCHPNHPPP